ncbi:MAG: His-Xaa-Ser system protein HxsD [Isosphaeraceae bacterium]|nr:His-Xaa-Ser system protein HxsD [Isosphaeraceae bacterium]
MDEIIIVVDPHVFRLSAVKKAAYRFGDRCFVHIEVVSEESIQVRLTAKSEKVPLHTLEGEFRNELLDQDLRESIADETERVRNLLLAQAFSALSLTDAVAETADYRDDPLGITRSQTTKQ